VVFGVLINFACLVYDLVKFHGGDFVVPVHCLEISETHVYLGVYVAARAVLLLLVHRRVADELFELLLRERPLSLSIKYFEKLSGKKK
jgi:hypothetical protein